MLGRGLESLIPKKEDEELGVGNQEPEAVLESVPPIGGAYPSASGLGQAPSEPVSLSTTSIDQEVKGLGERQKPSHFIRATDNRSAGTAVFQIEVQAIEPNPFQPRRDFNEEELRELAQSVREFGVIQPLIVSKIEQETGHGTEVKYQLIAGERRWRAAKMIGLERVPAIVRHIDTKKLNLELAIIENVQRADLNPLEAARAYARLQDEFGLTQREIAQRVCRSRESIANTLRLLNLSSEMQEAFLSGKINESQARVLLSMADLGQQKQMFAQLLGEGMSVRRLKQKVSGEPDPEKKYLERQLEDRLGAPVTISKRGGKGRLIIRFFSDEEMRGVMQRLLGQVD